jgi:23S rRNA (adenine2503-C2)-methyltransferase
MYELSHNYIKIHPQTKKQIKNLSFDELLEFLIASGEEKYRADQIMHEIFINRVDNFSKITQLPKQLRKFLDENFVLTSIGIDEKRISQDGSIKYLFSLDDGKSIEAVYMPWMNDDGELDRSTLCISTMSGCPVGCAFCATGTLGFKKNLTPSEIIDQVFLVEKDLNTKIDNIVLMGMGEPLLNYENVVRAITLLTDEKTKVISRRKITLSTSGIAPRIRQLAQTKYPPKLAISLHATTNGVRNKLMPISKSFDLSSLMDAVEYYYRQTKMKITYEYILFDGINDTMEDAERLRKIAQRVPSRINFIPFNDISFTKPQGISLELKPSPQERVHNIAEYLRSHKVPVIVRDTYGRDIEAACGQLALSREQIKQ